MNIHHQHVRVVERLFRSELRFSGSKNQHVVSQAVENLKTAERKLGKNFIDSMAEGVGLEINRYADNSISKTAFFNLILVTSQHAVDLAQNEAQETPRQLTDKFRQHANLLLTNSNCRKQLEKEELKENNGIFQIGHLLDLLENPVPLAIFDSIELNKPIHPSLFAATYNSKFFRTEQDLFDYAESFNKLNKAVTRNPEVIEKIEFIFANFLVGEKDEVLNLMDAISKLVADFPQHDHALGCCVEILKKKNAFSSSYSNHDVTVAIGDLLQTYRFEDEYTCISSCIASTGPSVSFRKSLELSEELAHQDLGLVNLTENLDVRQLIELAGLGTELKVGLAEPAYKKLRQLVKTEIISISDCEKIAMLFDKDRDFIRVFEADLQSKNLFSRLIQYGLTFDEAKPILESYSPTPGELHYVGNAENSRALQFAMQVAMVEERRLSASIVFLSRNIPDKYRDFFLHVITARSATESETFRLSELREISGILRDSTAQFSPSALAGRLEEVLRNSDLQQRKLLMAKFLATTARV